MSVYNRASDREQHGRLKRAYRCPPFPTSTPGRWVRAHMNRPRRHINRQLCDLVAAGNDPDTMVWPLGNRKPHFYYW